MRWPSMSSSSQSRSVARRERAPRGRARRPRRRWSRAASRRAGRSAARVGLRGEQPPWQAARTARPAVRSDTAVGGGRAATTRCPGRCRRTRPRRTGRRRRGCRRSRGSRRLSACSPPGSSRSPGARGNSGRAPAVPAHLADEQVDQPARSAVLLRAGASMAARNPSSLIAPRRYRLRSTRRAKPGYADGSRAGRPASRRRAGPLGPADEPGEERARSDASGHSEKTSSHWSTTAPCVPGPRQGEPSHRVLPGVMTETRGPSRSSAAAMPARASEDFPLPDGPTTETAPRSRRMSRQARTSRRGRRRPRRRRGRRAAARGRGRLVDGTGTLAMRESSWRRIASSSAASPGPGRPELFGQPRLPGGPSAGPRPGDRPGTGRARAAANGARAAAPPRPWPGRRQDLVVPAGPERGLDAELLGLAAQLLQAFGLDRGGLRHLKVLEGRASPQRQGLTQHVCRTVRLSERQQLAASADQTLEPAGVDVVGRAAPARSPAGTSGSPRCPAPDGSGRRSPGATCAPNAAGAPPTPPR